MILNTMIHVWTLFNDILRFQAFLFPVYFLLFSHRKATQHGFTNAIYLLSNLVMDTAAVFCY